MNSSHQSKISGTFVISVVTILMLASSLTAGVQDELHPPKAGYSQVLELDDGSTMIGSIVRVENGSVVFKTKVGEVTIPVGQIKNIKEVPNTAFRGGEYWFENPNRTRLFFSPTGRMLRAGEGYFSDYYLFFPGIAYAITDNITIGGGASIFPGVDANDQIFYITPKVGVAATENLSLAIGALIVKIPDWDDDNNSPVAGILWGVGTAGNDDHSFSAGLGFGFLDGELADKPAVMIGGETRMSKRSAFVTENWIFPDVDNPMISYGVRFFGEKLSVDLALLNVLSDEAIFPGVPYIDFVYNF